MPTSAVSSVTNTPPQSSVSTWGSPRLSQPSQQDERHDREDEEEQSGADVATRRAGPEQPDDQRGAENFGETDAPALG